MKKIMTIFSNDFSIAIKDPLLLWIALAPLVMALLIVLMTPGISDTSLYVASVDSETDMLNYFEKIAKVESYNSIEAVEARVLKKDHVIGIVPKANTYEIIAQGNEGESVEKFAKVILTLYQRNSDIDDSMAEIYDFGEKIAPIKRSLAASLLLMITILAGMIIASGIVDDKSDKTINAVNVTPVSKLEYIIGKSLIAIVLLFFSSIACLLILGLTDINWAQLFLVMITTSLISVILGFLMGITSSDIIEAAASIKMLLIPMIASVLVEEMTAAKWHITVYWSPFYWSYKSIKQIVVNNSASWHLLLINLLVVMITSVIVYFATKNRIKEGLS